MLILSRHVGQKIVIDENITITVMRIDRLYGDPVVRLGIDAPKEIPVHREEIQDAIDEDRRLGVQR